MLSTGSVLGIGLNGCLPVKSDVCVTNENFVRAKSVLIQLCHESCDLYGVRSLFYHFSINSEMATEPQFSGVYREKLMVSVGAEPQTAPPIRHL